MNRMKNRRERFLAAVFVVVAATNAWADELPRAEPEALGFSAERLDRIDRFYADEVKKGTLPGVVMLIAQHGKVAHFSAVGYADVEKRRPMQTDTIFRVYSMTKPVTSIALMTLYEEGRFQMRDPLSKYLPEFAHLRVLKDPDGDVNDTVPVKREPTIEDVLRHTAGFTHGLEASPFDLLYQKAGLFGVDVSLADMMHKLSTLPLRYQLGTKWV
jgi:CubicO group peptidase (beta-lactamase class C family)